MKPFLSNLVLFLALQALLLVAGITCLDALVTRRLETWKPSAGVTRLIIGDSHVRMALNDSLIPATLTLAHEAEPYRFSLLKIDFLLRRHHSIKEVNIGLSYHNLSSYYDADGLETPDISARYFFLLPIREKLAYCWNFRNQPVFYLRSVILNGLRDLVPGRRPYSFGKFQNTVGRSEARRISMLRRAFHQYSEPSGKLREISRSNERFLRKITECCRKNHVKIRTVNTPLHPYYKSLVPDRFVELRDSIESALNLERLDLESLPLETRDFFRDGDHLSSEGAAKASAAFGRIIGLR